MNAPTLIPPTKLSEPSLTNSGLLAETLPVESGSSDVRPALVIGDLHGHLDRFEALLKQEGLLGPCEHCDGTGQVWEPCTMPGTQCEYSCDHDRMVDCLNCDGDGEARTSKPAEVVLVGDIGHFGRGGSPTGDLLSWIAACRWADVILWGNHDRALVSKRHAFNGYQEPNPAIYSAINVARKQDKLKLAHVAHGFLITHAGLHLSFYDQSVPDLLKEDPVVFANWINEAEDESAEGLDSNQVGIRDAVGSRRGGIGAGGILWRDIEEKLFPFRQIFGHSADHKYRAVRYCTSHGGYSRLDLPKYTGQSYCIDIGGPDEYPGAKCLAGIWLPEERIVRVDL